MGSSGCLASGRNASATSRPYTASSLRAATGWSMFRADRRGAGEFRRPRRRQREDAGDDAGKRECQSGGGEKERGRPMPSPHRHGAEKGTNGDRQGESQEYGGQYGGESPNGANAVLNPRITGGDLRRRKREECCKREYADSEFHMAAIVIQGGSGIRDRRLDSSARAHRYSQCMTCCAQSPGRLVSVAHNGDEMTLPHRPMADITVRLPRFGNGSPGADGRPLVIPR